MTSPFKICQVCNESWPSRREFNLDRQVEIVGYQADPADPALGLFIFNHLSCGNTLTLSASMFTDLYSGKIYFQNEFQTENCKGLCSDVSNLEACPVECECAYIREILQLIRSRQVDVGDKPYTIQKKEGKVVIAFKNNPLLDTLLKAIYDIKKEHPRLNRLWDFRFKKITLDTPDIYKLADQAKMKFPEKVKVAILVDDDLSFGIFRMFGGLRGLDPADYGVFKSIQEAEAWTDS